MVKKEDDIEISRLQQNIESYLGLTTDSLVFDYQEAASGISLNLITVNAKHEQSFLFHSEEGFTKQDVLLKMLDYVKTYKEKFSSYTIQWCLKDDSELHTSYFRAKNIMDTLEKLHYGRDAGSLIVFSVVLNPIA